MRLCNITISLLLLHCLDFEKRKRKETQTLKPKKGKAVIFKNVDINGNIINQSLHGGEPVRSGQKWIINKWVHLN